MHSCFVLDIELYRKMLKYITEASLMTGLSFERLTLFIKKYEVDIFEAKLSGLSITQIPDCLCYAARDEPTVR